MATKNAFNSYKKPVRPEPIPAQLWSDNRPRTGTGLKAATLADVQAAMLTPLPKA